MTLLHPWLVPVLLVLVALVLGAGIVRSRRAPSGPDVLLAHTDRLTDLPSFRAARRRHRALLVVRAAALAVAVGGCVLLVARPVDVDTIEPDSRSRDVVLCLDVSSSMAATDAAVVDAFARVVEASPGDRTGLVLFASRPVQVFPLTDDTAYATAELRQVRAAYADGGNTGSAAWAGTTGGDGTSVIGDGVATCVAGFDRLDSARSRSIVLATDAVVSGPERVTLPQVGELAAARGIRIYGLNPADLADDGSRAAAAELRTASEVSGGGYFAVSDPGAVPDVVAALRSREADRATGSPRIVRVDDPGVLAPVVAGGALLFLLLGLPLRRDGRRWAVVAVVGVLAVVVVRGPTVPGGSAPVRSRDVDVYLVVDGTLSMAAEDQGGATRLSAVVADVGELTRRYAGARFSTVVSTTTAVQTMPLTTDAAAALTSVAALTPSTNGSAEGSDPRQASALLRRVLAEGARTSPGRAQLVFYFGDGEVTTARPSGPFDAAGSSGGAVLGYGTTAGGRMRDSGLFGGPDSFVLDHRPGHVGDAVSHEDPTTLQAIADELGVPFVQRIPGSSVDPVLAGAPPGRLRPVGGDLGTGTPLGWIAAAALLLVLTLDGVHWWTRRRS